MKKIWLILTVAIIGFGQIMAQDGYTPFVREGVQWVCYFENIKDFDVMGFQPGRKFFTLELKGDTVINGKEYKAMHKYSGNAIDPENDTVLVYLREENRIVYAIIPEGMASDSFMVGYGNLWDHIYADAKAGKEINTSLGTNRMSSVILALTRWKWEDSRSTATLSTTGKGSFTLSRG